MMVFNDVIKNHQRCVLACAETRDDCLSEQVEEYACTQRFEECNTVCDMDYGP